MQHAKQREVRMAVAESLDLIFRLKFEAAIQDHVAKKATSRRAKAEARKKAQALRDQAQSLEEGRAAASEAG
jgi:hypothetical protein